MGSVFPQDKLGWSFFFWRICTPRPRRGGSRRCGDVMGKYERRGREDIPLCIQERIDALACKDGSLFGVLADRHAFNS